MTQEIALDYVVEFDGTGTPTGTCWIDGSRYTFTASSLSLRIPRIDGKSTTKTSVAFQAYADALTGHTGSTVTVTPVKVDGTKHASVPHSKA
jgi:hypothetical protein